MNMLLNVQIFREMEDSVFKDKRKKIKVKERQFHTKLKSFKLHDVSLLESSSFDRHLTSMEPICFDVTDEIDEIITDLQEDVEDDDPRIIDLENISDKLLKALQEAKQELIMEEVIDRSNPVNNSLLTGSLYNVGACTHGGGVGLGVLVQ